MTLGNLVALAQKNIKRLLAYSSIAHAGYALIGLATLNPSGLAAAADYLLAYALAIWRPSRWSCWFRTSPGATT